MKQKTWFFLILGVIILGLGGYGYFKAIPSVENQTTNLPQIEISPQSFNFGDVEYGRVVEHTFKIKNSGEKSLEIKRVATSCGCTTAEVAEENINPGEDTNLLVVYDTGAMSGPYAKGEQERIIYIKSNDPINPQVEVLIYANVK